MPLGARSLLSFIVAIGVGSAAAQSSCSSDGQVAPRVILERFISADCAPCWSDVATARQPKGGLALDWIVPGSQGEEAPLSAVANRDAATRLEALGLAAPAGGLNHASKLHPHSRSSGRQTGTSAQMLAPTARLRVARGVALNAYMGASIELSLPQKLAENGPLTAWLLLVEAVPRGTEGSAVDRLLVRNVLTLAWNQGQRLSENDQLKQRQLKPGPVKQEPRAVQKFFESRPMSLPPGTNPDQLRVVGWVENTRKQIIASAVSFCDHQK